MRLQTKSKIPLLREAGTDNEGIGRATLDVLLNKPIGPPRQDRMDTVEAWCRRAAGRVDGFDPRAAMRTLDTVGLKIVWDADRDAYLAVAHWHVALSQLFGPEQRGLRFGTLGSWVYDLRLLPGARATGGGLSFHDKKSRAVLIPFDLIFSADQHGSPLRAPCAA